MKTNHLTEEQLVLCHYGEAEVEDRRHLEACADCRRALAALAADLETVSHLPEPSVPDGYGRDLWHRLEPRLESQLEARRALRSGPTSPRRFAEVVASRKASGSRFRARFAPWVMLAAAALAAVFVAGRLSAPKSAPGSGATVATATPAAFPEAVPAEAGILLAAAGDHLDRSERLLLDLLHETSESPAGSATEPSRARELVGGSRLLRQSAGLQGETAVVAVLDQLERLLLDLAHSPGDEAEGSDFQAYEDLRRRVRDEGLLLKLRLLSDTLERRLRSAAPEEPLTTPASPRSTASV